MLAFTLQAKLAPKYIKHKTKESVLIQNVQARMSIGVDRPDIIQTEHRKGLLLTVKWYTSLHLKIKGY